jgi:alkanesulfonate monooxygenase SsuD/methylene tetrahydromethanopterin reductase-like flavin-dependent oxidoreductase (luciferase family)
MVTQPASRPRMRCPGRWPGSVDVLEAVWGPDPVSYTGPRTIIDKATVLPKPAAKIPVMLAGGAAGGRALERLAARADGWLPIVGAGQFEATARTWDRIREAAAAHGRDASRMELIVVGNVTLAGHPLPAGRAPFTGTLDQVTEDILAASAAGADEVVIDLNLQPRFTGAAQVLETAQEIQERAKEARA